MQRNSSCAKDTDALYAHPPYYQSVPYFDNISNIKYILYMNMQIKI